MTIYRIKKINNFVTLDKTFIDDPNLSWRAKGVLVYLLSKPENWAVRITDLIKHSTNKRDAVYAILKELKQLRYIVCSQTQDVEGRFNAVEYNVYEKPQPEEDIVCQKFAQESPLPEKPYTEKPDPEKPYAGKPDPEIPHTEKPMLVNNNNNKNNNIKKITAAKETRKRTACPAPLNCCC